MWNQTFDPSDIPRLLTLAFLELALSADNAIVLGLLTHSLPISLRSKALLIGSLSAFVFRAVAVLTIGWMLHYFWVQIIGGVYLIYLFIHHFWKKRKNKTLFSPSHFSFWKTVLLIELFDLAFALDSILAALAFVTPANGLTTFSPKLWIVYVGGMMGLLGVRYAAHWFSDLIDQFPRLETSAFLLIGWIGLKLCYQGAAPFLSYRFPYELLFWPVLVLILAFGFTRKTRKT